MGDFYRPDNSQYAARPPFSRSRPYDRDEYLTAIKRSRSYEDCQIPLETFAGTVSIVIPIQFPNVNFNFNCIINIEQKQS